MPTATKPAHGCAACTAPSRRVWLQQVAALAATGLGAMPSWAASPARPAPPQVLTAWNHAEQSWAGLWTPGRAPRGVVLPARAHQVVVLPPSPQRTRAQALVLARRPGEYLLRMDPMRGTALQWHRMEDDRYLGGHAVLAADGHSFFTTESDGVSGQGLIAQRDLHSLEKLREFPSGGIGPHALLLEPDGALLVANGGILNLPETGRRKLNTGRMDSNLTRLDTQSGQVQAQYRLPDPFLSLRHLAIAPNGTIAVALQAEHPSAVARQSAPALALLQTDTLHALEWAPSQTPHAWEGYAGDICFAADRFWASAPHENALVSWSVQGDAHPTQILPGAAALAAKQDGVLVTGAVATLLRPTAPPVQWSSAPGLDWDNHATLL